MTQFSPTPDTFAQRLAAVSQQTGLSPAQLGVARVYDRPHVDSASRASHLSGEELLVKDTQQVAGEWVTMGNARQGFRAAHSDTAVENLLATGARLVGASASAEYGTSAYTEPVEQEAPVNPISPSMMTGGSSGGAAAAVGHGVARIAHATDGGGSIRVPAACCGLVGLKPAHDTAVGGFNPSPRLPCGLLREHAQGLSAAPHPTVGSAGGLYESAFPPPLPGGSGDRRGHRRGHRAVNQRGIGGGGPPGAPAL